MTLAGGDGIGRVARSFRLILMINQIKKTAIRATAMPPITAPMTVVSGVGVSSPPSLLLPDWPEDASEELDCSRGAVFEAAAPEGATGPLEW